MIVLFFSVLLRKREYLATIKEEKLNAELLSLKSQINPHFLFNTLNSIYVLSIKKDDKASEAIIGLSELMRYVIKDAQDDKILLSKEISYIYSYILLQKARLGNTGKVQFTCTGEPGEMKITPLILITYIENAFKYGINPDVDESMVEIYLRVTETGISLSTSNTKAQTCSSNVTTGIGMNNTKERLHLLYPDKHKLEVSENDQMYYVELAIELI
ncbi:Sensor histidine kinase YpdA [compost metagenome]